MSKPMQATVCLGISVIWATWTAGVAEAQPSQYCRDLAQQYATAPDQLDAAALAALRDCEVATSQQQSEPVNTDDPSAQQRVSPGNTPMDKPGWGEWSAPPAWSDDRAKTKSWGSQ